METVPYSLLSTTRARVLAILLCLPLIGGRGFAVMVDMIVYPYGACCCERAHGATHHCRCADPHEAEEADAAHQVGVCPDQWDDGGAEFGSPTLWQMPLATLIVPPQLAPDASAWEPPQRTPHLLDSRPEPPPTPPPDSDLV